ncbi:MAG: hypothetical protein KKE17_07240, partial [Proteobacteria bacterium]|nr:hypothetical protein [Pseudomonadota bacterium]MBU1709782.1 hypothetical protein [Pseudomonadota bacterium]
YSFGVLDVHDFYQKGAPAWEKTDAFPVGIAYRATANFDNGFRADVGIGPVVHIGDLGTPVQGYEYSDKPLNATVGYSFILSKNTKVYIRSGLVYHYLGKGGYQNKNDAFGVLGAVGVEFAKQRKMSGFLEVAYDNTEVTFEYNCGAVSCAQREDIKISGFVVSFGISF